MGLSHACHKLVTRLFFCNVTDVLAKTNTACRTADTRAAQLRQLQPTDKRPAYKAILLSGAPGIGKTTLAHIVARHCGYRAVEINASDERTEPALRKAICAAVQMQVPLVNTT